jgi:hypothetical protein
VWIYVPSVSSPAPEASTSPSTSPLNTSDWESLARCVTLNGKSPQPQYLQRALQMDRFRPLQFRRMSQPSMDAAFEAWLTSSTADSPAPTSASPGSKPESPAKLRASGSSTSASFATFDPDGSLSKTSRQYSMWEQEEQYSENLPASGSMRNGSLCERPTWVPRISGSGCSSSLETWRTPAAGHPAKGGSQTGGPDLQEAVSMWMTPDVPNGGRAMKPEDIAAKGSTDGGKRQVGLSNQVSLWATPASRDYRTPNRLPYSERGGGSKGEQLQNQVAHHWPTPAGMNGTDHSGKVGGGGEFAKTVQNWPTPRSEDSESCGNHPGATDSLTGATRNWESSLQAPATSALGNESSPSAQTSAPATESGARGLADVVADRMDERAARLRAGGNGVVALAGAAAFIELFRRMKP